MTLERSTYQMSSDRTNELLSKERQLFALADAWNEYKDAPVGLEKFLTVASLLDTVVREANPTEPMCVYCGWSGEGLAKHERDCKPAWAVLDKEGRQ